jgi:hypothetical protein
MSRSATGPDIKTGPGNEMNKGGAVKETKL